MQDVILKQPEGEKVTLNKTPEQKAAEAEANDPSVLFRWSAPEYAFKPKTNDWFWAVGIITLALAIASFFMDNFFFAVISIVGGFSIAMMGARKPVMLNFKITEKGIKTDNKIYLFKDISSFCINEDAPNEPRLFLNMSKGLSSQLIFLLGKADTKSLEDVLKRYLKAEDISEPFTSLLMRLLGI